LASRDAAEGAVVLALLLNRVLAIDEKFNLQFSTEEIEQMKNTG